MRSRSFRRTGRLRRELAAAAALAAAASALLAAAACKRRERGERAAEPGAGVALPPPLAGDARFRIDVGPQTPCTAGAPCEARIAVTALGGYKLERGYPVQLVAEPVSGVDLDGAGAFALDDARSGTLTLRFRAAAPGRARFSGTLKLSVCQKERCEAGEARIQLELPVT
jgi:hypothetical protein